ncbi:HTH-type transcriptional activator RhaS [Sulfitobacter sp. DSM 110093]|uniref:AraC family transcriptional regulator n=1 Tax=Sulfitobacter sp. DSM 110093 TaxID=2883127 RepID=UPI001FAC301F|nr:AraC family transcriptional regulator [Sulfitobacter sp. DSM 110093]UOA32787.1 HTH-type transcriptional activator RhaS [Sulfitobacter sp. DSM 110093]
MSLHRQSYFSDHPVLRTRDLDEARFKVSQRFCDHRLDVSNRNSQLSVTHNAVRGQHLSVNYLSYGAEVTVDPGELGSFYLFQMPLSGKASVAHRGDEMTAHVGMGTILNPDRSALLRWGESCQKLLFQIDSAHLETVARNLTGAPPPGPIRFDMKVDFTRPNGRKLQRAFAACAAAIENGGLFQRPLSGSDLQVEHDLVYALLTLQKSNISHIIARSDGGTRPRDIRHALEFMHANLAEQITVLDIATAAEVNVRTLQKSFLRVFRKTPMQVLRDTRLDAAHYLLHARRDVPSVSEAAYSCGFSHMGRFASYYRTRFGHTPCKRK